MTLNLPLLYVLWLEEYCQISPNKNKSPNLWYVTSILVCCIFGYKILWCRDEKKKHVLRFVYLWMMCMSGDNLSVYKHPVSNEKVTGQNHSKNNRLPKRFKKNRQRERGQSHESTFKMKMNTTANSDKRGEKHFEWAPCKKVRFKCTSMLAVGL